MGWPFPSVATKKSKAFTLQLNQARIAVCQPQTRSARLWWGREASSIQTVSPAVALASQERLPQQNIGASAWQYKLQLSPPPRGWTQRTHVKKQPEGPFWSPICVSHAIVAFFWFPQKFLRTPIIKHLSVCTLSHQNSMIFTKQSIFMPYFTRK